MFKYLHVIPKLPTHTRTHLIAVDIQHQEYSGAPVKTIATADFDKRTGILSNVQWNKGSIMKPVFYFGDVVTLVSKTPNSRRTLRGHFGIDSDTLQFILKELDSNLFL